MPGIYYKPGSHRAKLCVSGAKLMYSFCEQQHIPHQRVGKLIVATDDTERDRLRQIYKNALINGVSGVELLGTSSTG